MCMDGSMVVDFPPMRPCGVVVIHEWCVDEAIETKRGQTLRELDARLA